MKNQCEILITIILSSWIVCSAQQRSVCLSVKYDAHIKATQEDEIKAHPCELDIKLGYSMMREAPQEILAAILELRRALRDNNYDSKKKNILICGPYGSGKTAFSQAIPRVDGLKVFNYNAYEIDNNFELSGIRNLELIFEKAAAINEPCVIILNKMQCIFKTNDYELLEDGLMLKLFELIDRYKTHKIAVIGTANNISNLSPVIKASFLERFSTIELSLPNEDQRIAALRYHVENYEKIQQDFSTNCYREIAQRTEAYCYRRLAELVRAVVCDLASIKTKNELSLKLSVYDFFSKINEFKAREASNKQKNTPKSFFSIYKNYNSLQNLFCLAAPFIIILIGIAGRIKASHSAIK